MTDSSWIEIDLARLDGNLAVIRQRVGPAVKICGVVKADAYGLGAGPIAVRLAHRGIDMLAVYSPDQAAELVSRDIRCPLLILMPLRHLDRKHPLYDTAVGGRLHLSVQDEAHLLQIDELGRSMGCPLPVHLHLDTGMSRAGLNREQLARVIDRSGQCKSARVAGLYTHFTAADDDMESTDRQMETLEQAFEAHRDALPEDVVVHAANTFATHRGSRFHCSMVRVGLGLFGYGPELMSGGPIPSGPPPLQPVMRWLSRIVHVQQYPRGSAVGYNRTYRLTRDSLLGVVPVGYADGYPLALGNRAFVGLVSESGPCGAVPVRGKVNMDQIVIDLTEAPLDAARVGTLVELTSWNPDSPCALPALAELADSNCHEMLCRLSSCLPRKYTGGVMPNADC